MEASPSRAKIISVEIERNGAQAEGEENQSRDSQHAANQHPWRSSTLSALSAIRHVTHVLFRSHGFILYQNLACSRSASVDKDGLAVQSDVAGYGLEKSIDLT